MTLPALRDFFVRHREKATGVWRVGQELTRTIYLEMGDIVYAASTHPQDRLTHLLVERRKVTQAQLDYALANLNPGMSVGKNLIEMGFITQRDLLEVARAQVERVVWACLAIQETPTFDDRPLDATVVRLPFDTSALLLGGVMSRRTGRRCWTSWAPSTRSWCWKAGACWRCPSPWTSPESQACWTAAGPSWS